MLPPERRTQRARELRSTQTRAEARLWQAVRGGRLDGHKFRRQFGIDRYFVDFACESLMLVIELDGGVHGTDDAILADHLRQQEIETLGWSVLRFPNADVMARLDDVLTAIRDHARLARP